MTRNTPERVGSNIPEATSDRVADRVEELTEADRAAAAKRRIAELTGQSPEEVPDDPAAGDDAVEPADEWCDCGEPGCGIPRPLTDDEEAFVTAPTREADGMRPIDVEHDSDLDAEHLDTGQKWQRFIRGGIFTAPALPTIERVEPTYDERVAAIRDAKSILGAMRPTHEFVYLAEWLLGLLPAGGDDDAE